MNNQLSLFHPEVVIHNGKVVTTSVAIANYFQKTHDNVLKKIRSVITDCDENYHLVNFNEVVRDVIGGDGAVRKMPMFELTRDGFVLIAMGFTGKKALQWKVNYINAFNRMEAELHSIPKCRSEAPELLNDNDTRNLAHLVWSMANGFRFERAWTQGIWYALRHATGIASPQHFEVNQIAIIAEECRRIYGMTNTLKSAIFDAEKQVIRRLLRHKDDAETVLHEIQQLLEASTHEHDSVMTQSLERWQQANVNRFLQRN